jgi:hypothetical protein
MLGQARGRRRTLSYYEETTMPKTTSFYLSDDALAVLERRERDREHGGKSGMLDAILGRYAEICKRELPDLSVPEWKAIFDVLNGCWMVDRPEGIHTYLRMEVTDGIGLNELDKKWAINGKALIKKLEALTYAQAVAVWDAAERFWGEVSDGNQKAKVPGEK